MPHQRYPIHSAAKVQGFQTAIALQNGGRFRLNRQKKHDARKPQEKARLRGQNQGRKASQ